MKQSEQNWLNQQLTYCIITDIVAVSKLERTNHGCFFSWACTSAAFPGGALPYETLGDALRRNLECKLKFLVPSRVLRENRHKL